MDTKMRPCPQRRVHTAGWVTGSPQGAPSSGGNVIVARTSLSGSESTQYRSVFSSTVSMPATIGWSETTVRQWGTKLPGWQTNQPPVIH